MAEVLHPTPVDARSHGPAAPDLSGLSVRDVIGHVTFVVAGEHRPLPVERMIDIVDACVRLGAQRQALSAGLLTQEALDRLAQIVIGREMAGQASPSDRATVESNQDDIRMRLARILADWSRAGQRFTRVTRLLPTQFSRAWPTRPVLDTAQRRALEQCVPAGMETAFEHARTHHASAQRRCIRAALEVERGHVEGQRLASAFRAGQCPAAQVSQALMHLQRQVESGLNAEAERLVSQHVMEFLAQPIQR